MSEEAESMELSAGAARRACSLRGGAARAAAVNFMPSRQPHNTLRPRRARGEQRALLDAPCDAPDAPDAPDAADQQADVIVREMEQHRLLMEDNPLSEELRRQALRELPQGLTVKRTVRAKLSASVSLRSRRRPISLLKRTKYRISFAWKRTRDRFRDFIFSIELWYEAIRDVEGHLGSAVGSYFHLLRWLFGLNLLLSALLLCFVVLPQALHDRAGNATVELSALDFISGKGALERTPLLFGHYHDGETAAPGALRYYMPFAYFYTMLCLYLMFFAVLCYRTADSYRRNFIEPAGDGALPHLLAAKLFCGWDFGIASPRGAALAAHALFLEFKELLNERRARAAASRWERAGRRAGNALAWALVLGAGAGALLGLWRLLARGAGELYTSLAVTAAAAACPVLLGLVVKLEHYEARTAFYVTLARTWLLDVGALLVLLVYWARSGDECWESRVGQEGYRLVVLDAAVSLLLIPAVELARGLLFKCGALATPPAFDIAYNSLTLIYNQSVLWLAVLFAPPLVFAVALKFLLLFYVKRATALRTCHAGKKVWRAAQTQTVLYMLVTLSLFATLFAIGSLFLRSASRACGPFRQYERVFAVLSEGLLRLSQRAWLRAALHFALRPGPIAFALLALGVGVYMQRARAAAQRCSARLLRRMLRLQAKDKEFLLAAIEKVSNGEWLYSPKAEEYGADSHTWKYLNEVRKPSNAGFHFDGSRLSHSFPERPGSFAREERPRGDGDSDSSFSWRGSGARLARADGEDG